MRTSLLISRPASEIFIVKGKKILLISPQTWGKMFVAKHHYAVELSREGNEVFFLNPPSDDLANSLEVKPVEEYPGLYIISHRLKVPDLLRFKVRWLYDKLMKIHISNLLRRIKIQFDLVWCFDCNLYSDLNWFKAPRQIYHPVDELFYDYQIWPGKNADLIISVTKEILSRFPFGDEKKLFINHGISREFAEAVGKSAWTKKDKIRIGYSGNLLRPDIDFETLKICISKFPEVQFIFWGNYKTKGGNLPSNISEEAASFIDFLQKANNVELKGQLSANQLPGEYSMADIFLICYDIKKDQSSGTNYHKAMEFLSTGKIILSNNVTTYQGTGLMEMCTSRENNKEFPGLLEKVINNIDQFNSEVLQLQRKDYALDNTYEKHLAFISSRLGSD